MLYFALSSVIISLLAGITLFAVLRDKSASIGGKPAKLTNHDIKIGTCIGMIYFALSLCVLIPVIIGESLLFIKAVIRSILS